MKNKIQSNWQFGLDKNVIAYKKMEFSVVQTQQRQIECLWAEMNELDTNPIRLAGS